MKYKKSVAATGYWVGVLLAVIAIVIASVIVINTQGGIEQVFLKLRGLMYA